MNETDWANATEIFPLLCHLHPRAGARKLRLFTHACELAARGGEPMFPADLDELEVWATVERLADGQATEAGWVAACRKAGWSDEVAATLTGAVVGLDLDNLCSLHRAFTSSPACHSRFQCDLIRCILGNPFRPVALDPSWLTSTVIALARGVYADRALDRLPILADALQDAGCEEEDVLDHCRGGGPHARGCWVVDLVLGKS
jgi:hypothetical protein